MEKMAELKITLMGTLFTKICFCIAILLALMNLASENYSATMGWLVASINALAALSNADMFNYLAERVNKAINGHR